MTAFAEKLNFLIRTQTAFCIPYIAAHNSYTYYQRESRESRRSPSAMRTRCRGWSINPLCECNFIPQTYLLLNLHLLNISSKNQKKMSSIFFRSNIYLKFLLKKYFPYILYKMYVWNLVAFSTEIQTSTLLQKKITNLNIYLFYQLLIKQTNLFYWLLIKTKPNRWKFNFFPFS